MKKIIYINDESQLSVITPSGDLTVEKTALKDVPTGVKYKIIEDTDLPPDRDFRNAWEYDFDKNGHDGVGA